MSNMSLLYNFLKPTNKQMASKRKLARDSSSNQPVSYDKLREIIEILRNLRERQSILEREKKRNKNLIDIWEYFAVLLDRICFMLYFIVIISCLFLFFPRPN